MISKSNYIKKKNTFRHHYQDNFKQLSKKWIVIHQLDIARQKTKTSKRYQNLLEEEEIKESRYGWE